MIKTVNACEFYICHVVIAAKNAGFKLINTFSAFKNSVFLWCVSFIPTTSVVPI